MCFLRRARQSEAGLLGVLAASGYVTCQALSTSVGTPISQTSRSRCSRGSGGTFSWLFPHFDVWSGAAAGMPPGSAAASAFLLGRLTREAFEAGPRTGGPSRSQRARTPALLRGAACDSAILDNVRIGLGRPRNLPASPTIRSARSPRRVLDRFCRTDIQGLVDFTLGPPRFGARQRWS